MLGGTVVISGDTTICPGDSANIRLQFTGQPPFDAYITRTSAAYDTLQDIYSTDTIIKVELEGIYRVSDMFDATGSGVSNGSATVNSYNRPSAVLGGSRSICEEDSTQLTVNLSGAAPWNIVLDVNGENLVYSDIEDEIFNMYINQQGVYEVVEVKDSYCYGEASGQFELSHYPKSNATLFGESTICEESSMPLVFLFEGDQPWEVAYEVNGILTDTVHDITQTPFYYNVSQEGTYTINHIKDARGCIGNFSGTAQVTHHEKTDVQITNLNSTYAITHPPVTLTATPSGGEFKGNGVVSSTGTFYPDIAGSLGTSHEIIYYYIDPVTGCLSTDTALVNVIEAAASLILEDEKEVYCFNGDPILLTGANVENTIGKFSISGGKGLVDHNDNTATVYPSQLSGGTYTITYSDNDGSLFSVEKQINVEYLEEIYFIGLTDKNFCANEPPVELTGNQQGGVFMGSGVEVDSTGTFYFNPSNANVGTNTIVYSFTSVNGCTRDTTSDVMVFALPDIDFTVSDSCVDERNPYPVRFLNLTASEQPVTEWFWTFNDAGSGVQNTSTLENPTHVYSTAGSRSVQLTATTNVGCENTGAKTIIFGDKPASSFTVSSECYNSDSAIQFVNTSTSKTEIASYLWEFRHGSSVITSEEENTSQVFPELKNYDIRFITETAAGCKDTSIYSLELKPTIDLSEGPYFQDFELGRGSWNTENEFNGQINSWTFGTPDEYFTTAGSSNKAWYTDIGVREMEQSWVKSPCFSFSNSKKPYISFDVWRIFEQTRDGAALQYTTNNGATWSLVGGLNDGINWFNSYQIIGLPGNQSIGWSNIIDNQWVETRHRLDSLIGKSNVQFRIVYGSDGTGLNNQGISFDNIWISERQHQVLIEHFTNINDSAILYSNSLVNNLTRDNKKDVVNIQYHTGFPNIDSFNLVNPVDPSARLLYYGISETPYSVIDGRNTFDYTEGNEPGDNILIQGSLQDPTFSLSLEPEIVDNTLQVSYSIRALSQMPSANYTLYIAVLENNLSYRVSSDSTELYQSVFRKFLPDAAGINFKNAWLLDQTKQGNVVWDMNTIHDRNNIELVAFLQNQNTREVVQVTSKKDFLSSTNNPVSEVRNPFELYPNPAGNRVVIEFSEIQEKPVTIYFYSTTGTLALSKVLSPGISSAELDLNKLPKGVYFVRFNHPASKSAVVKLIKSE